MLEAARCIVVRDLLVAWRRRSDVATALLFFVIVTSLFPLGIGAEPDLLRSIAPGVIWVAALLSCMLSLGRLFAADHADGTLEQLLLSSEPLGVIAAAKALAHWLVSGLPLVLIAPLIALQYDLAAPLYPVLALSLLLGTPVLSLIGAIGAALTLGLRGGGSDRALVRRRGSRALRGGALHRLVRRADRRAAGRGLPHHLHPRPGGVDVDVHLRDDGVLGGHRPGVQHAALAHDGERARAHRRAVHLHRAVDRLVLGQADLGHLVGLGRAPHLGADPAVPVLRLHGAAGGDRRPATSGTRRRAARDRRRGERPDHLLLGTVVEHAAPGRVRQPDPGAEHGGDDADRDAGHGACLLDVQHRGNVAARAPSYPGAPVREFFAMSGYGLYVWGAYGVTFLLIGVEIALLVNRSRKCSETKT